MVVHWPIPEHNEGELFFFFFQFYFRVHYARRKPFTYNGRVHGVHSRRTYLRENLTILFPPEVMVLLFGLAETIKQ